MTKIKVGILGSGNIGTDLMYKILKKAQTANKMSSRENPVTAFSELGILGVLVYEENKLVIRQIAELTLGIFTRTLIRIKLI